MQHPKSDMIVLNPTAFKELTKAKRQKCSITGRHRSVMWWLRVTTVDKRCLLSVTTLWSLMIKPDQKKMILHKKGPGPVFLLVNSLTHRDEWFISTTLVSDKFIHYWSLQKQISIDTSRALYHFDYQHVSCAQMFHHSHVSIKSCHPINEYNACVCVAMPFVWGAIFVKESPYPVTHPGYMYLVVIWRAVYGWSLYIAARTSYRQLLVKKTANTTTP